MILCKVVFKVNVVQVIIFVFTLPKQSLVITYFFTYRHSLSFQCHFNLQQFSFYSFIFLLTFYQLLKHCVCSCTVQNERFFSCCLNTLNGVGRASSEYVHFWTKYSFWIYLCSDNLLFKNISLNYSLLFLLSRQRYFNIKLNLILLSIMQMWCQFFSNKVTRFRLHKKAQAQASLLTMDSQQDAHTVDTFKVAIH